MSTPSIASTVSVTPSVSYSLTSVSGTPTDFTNTITASSPLIPDNRPSLKGDKMVVGGAQAAIKESGKILRLARLSLALPPSSFPRKAKIAQLNDVWKKFLNSETPIAAADVIEALKEVSPKIVEIYAPEIESATDLGKRIKSLMKDTQSIATITPVTPAMGERGPTLLVNYPTLDQGMRGYVIKCTDPNELEFNGIYHAVSHFFAEGTDSWGFSVPLFSRFDFSKNTYESPLRESTYLSPELSAHAKNNFTMLAKLVDKNKTPDAAHLMLAEKIKGPNLIDFMLTDYKNLTEELKSKFFERLGRLAILGLVIGTLDGVIKVEGRYTDYRIGRPAPNNLGNVLVSQSDVHLYAIDNGISEDLINNQEKRANFANFLTTHFQGKESIRKGFEELAGRITGSQSSDRITQNIASYLVTSKKPFDQIVDNIVQSTEMALQDRIDDIKGDVKVKNPAEIEKNMTQFIADLNRAPKDGKTPKEALLRGLKQMARWLKNEAIPHLWEKSDEGIAIRKHLQDVYPEYLQSIQERFNAFKGASL